jgi:hypothetical protein
MRWSRRGAELLLQVRCAAANGNLHSGFDHLFGADANPSPGMALDVCPQSVDVPRWRQAPVANTIATGVIERVTWPVGASRPVVWSIRNCTMLSPFWLAT